MRTERLLYSVLFLCRTRGIPFFSSRVRSGSRAAQAQWARLGPGAARQLQCACAGAVAIIPQPRLYWGCLFLGTVRYVESSHVSGSSPGAQSCRLWRGRRERVGPLLRMRACLAQVLHHAATSGLRRGFAISLLWHDLWTPSLAWDVPRKLMR